MSGGVREVVSSWPIVVMVVSAPILVAGAVSVNTNTADLSQWLSSSQTNEGPYHRFLQSFGSDEFLLITWPGCGLEDERLERLDAALMQRAGPDAVNPQARLMERVVTGPEMLRSLTSKPLELPEEEALARMEGILVGFDPLVTAAIVELTETGRSNPWSVVDVVVSTAQEVCGLDRQTLRLGGSVYEAVSIDAEADRSLRRFLLPVWLIGFLVAWCCLRRIRLTLIVVAIGLYCECLAVAALHYSQGQLNAIMIVMPTLVYVLAISATIHMVNYYLDAVRAGDLQEAPRQALRVGWLPCTLAAISTAIGLASLGVSDIRAVRSFGIYSAAGVLMALAVLLAVLPAALRLWPSSTAPRADGGPSSSVADRPPRVDLALRLADFVIAHHRWLSWLCLAVSVLLALGLFRIKTSVKLEDMFVRDSQIVTEYAWIEEHIGPLIPIEVVVSFDQQCQLDGLARLDLISTIGKAVREIPEVGGVLSTATFLPDVPRRKSVRDTIRRAIMARQIERARDQLIDEGYLAVSERGELWRVTARVPALHSLDYGEFVDRIRRQVAPILDEQQDHGAGRIGVVYTGLGPAVHEVQLQLIGDLIKSLSLALLILCPLMVFLLRGLWAGMLSMVPNVVPMITVLGGMGWLGVRLDIGSMMTMSVALGIAIDDTVHFLTWYARGIRSGLSTQGAVREAYQRCAIAMFQTTTICGLALLVFSLSDFLPTARFGRLMAVLLLAALVSDLLLLPAILAGPLGRFFSLRLSTDAIDPDCEHET